MGHKPLIWVTGGIPKLDSHYKEKQSLKIGKKPITVLIRWDNTQKGEDFWEIKPYGSKN